MNRKDLHALTLLGLPKDKPESDSLAVLHQLIMSPDSQMKIFTYTFLLSVTKVGNKGMALVA